MIGFQTGPGAGGREGLRPRSRWFDVTKWQALAVRQVARELRISHVWSWGWAQRDARSNDPDKTLAACVWLWSRDAKLCDAPRIVGRELDPDVATGQLNLPAGTRCVYGTTPLTASSVAALARVTGDRELALTTLVVRAIERERARVSSRRSRSRSSSGSCGSASGAVLRPTVPRSRMRAQAPRSRVGSSATSSGPARSRVGFRACGSLRATSPASERRSPRSSRASSSWRPRRAGCREAAALLWRRPPRRAFSVCGRDGGTTVRTVEGVFVVEPLDDATALAALPSALARSRSCASSPPSAARMRTQRGRSACRKRPRATRVRARPTARARRRRQLLVRAVPLALRARGRSLARGSPQLATSRAGRFAAVTTMSRPELLASPRAASARTMRCRIVVREHSAMPPENETTPRLGSGRSRSAAWSSRRALPRRGCRPGRERRRSGRRRSGTRGRAARRRPEGPSPCWRARRPLRGDRSVR